MEPIHRLKLKRNMGRLLEDLDAYYLLPDLAQEGIITQEVWDEIMAMEPKTARTRTTELLRRLPKCGPKAYEVFCLALDKRKYGFLREALEKTVITEEELADDIDIESGLGSTQEPPNNPNKAQQRRITGNVVGSSGITAAVIQGNVSILQK